MARTEFAGIEWTEEMDSLLGKVTDMDAAKHLGLSDDTVRKRRHELGISAFGEFSNQRLFQEKVLALAKDHSCIEIALQLGVSAGVVRKAAKAQNDGKPLRFARKKREKHDLAAAQEWASRHDGTCLSDVYNAKSMRWLCKLGHEWTAPADRVAKGSWCRRCRESRLTEEWLKNYAQARKGVFLGSEGNRYVFQCEYGHIWKPTPASLHQESWCVTCAKPRGGPKGSIEEMRALAAARGGECLSAEYEGSTVPLRWRCSDGHEWLSRPANVKSGTWCIDCHYGRPRQWVRHGGGESRKVTAKSNLKLEGNETKKGIIRRDVARMRAASRR